MVRYPRLRRTVIHWPAVARTWEWKILNRAPLDEVKKPLRQNRKAHAHQQGPEWAAGLRRLYDSVVEEPIPDSFALLLDKLDDPNG